MSKPTEILFRIHHELEELAEKSATEQHADRGAQERILEYYEGEFARWLVEKFKDEVL